MPPTSVLHPMQRSETWSYKFENFDFFLPVLGDIRFAHFHKLWKTADYAPAQVPNRST